MHVSRTTHFMAAAWLMCATTATAGAWPQEAGRTQVIVSYEPGRAETVFNASGRSQSTITDWRQNDVSLYAERGITPRFTIMGKVYYKSYETPSDRFSGFNALEVGGRYTVLRGDSHVVAISASVIGGGQGRRSDFDLSGKQGTDYDLRAYAGHSFRLAGIDAFATVEAARHLRENEADQWRVDSTLGLKPSPRWLIMAQTFSGRTDRQSWGQAEWTHAQVSIVRHFGRDNDLSLQLALRRTLAGRNVPAVNAVVVGLWKRY